MPSARSASEGRRWLFCDTVAGAKSSANLYSLIETAKANGLEPHAYLRHVFAELPKASSVEDIERLLPTPPDFYPTPAEAPLLRCPPGIPHTALPGRLR